MMNADEVLSELRLRLANLAAEAPDQIRYLRSLGQVSVDELAIELDDTIAAARDAVHAFVARGIAVSGVEGFRVTESSTEPLLDYIAYWPTTSTLPPSEERDVRESAVYCLRALAQREADAPPDFMVSIAAHE